MGEKVQLEYAIAGPRWDRRLLTWGAVLGAMAVGGYLLYANLWQRVVELNRQHECMTFSLPAGTTVYEEDHAIAARLLKEVALGPDRTIGWDCSFYPPTFLAYYAVSPMYFRAYVCDRLIAVPFALHMFQNTDPALFMHWRQAMGMDARLVFVWGNIFELRGGAGDPLRKTVQLFCPVLDWIVIKPEGLRSQPAVFASGSWNDPLFTGRMPKPLTIYAGQADSADDSHFTIDFKLPARRGRIDGWLQSNDQLKFFVRMTDGPVSP